MDRKTGLTVMGAALAGVVATAGVLVLARSGDGTPDDPEVASRAREEAARAKADVAIAELKKQHEASDEKERAAEKAEASGLKLPPAPGFNATKIIGKRLADVQRVLGHGEKRPDGKWKHQIGDAPFVVVVYESARAVGIEAPTITNPSGQWTEEDFAHITAWFGGGDADDGAFTVGASISKVGIAIYDTKYFDAVQAKIEAKAQAAAKAEEAKRKKAIASRVMHAALIAPAMRRYGRSIRAWTSGTDDTVLNVAFDETCSKEALAGMLVITNWYKLFKKIGFVEARCDDGPVWASVPLTLNIDQ